MCLWYDKYTCSTNQFHAAEKKGALKRRRKKIIIWGEKSGYFIWISLNTAACVEQKRPVQKFIIIWQYEMSLK